LMLGGCGVIGGGELLSFQTIVQDILSAAISLRF